jgi:2-iminoacetate synthase
MNRPLPDWLDPAPWLAPGEPAAAAVVAALDSESPGPGELAALLSPAADPYLEAMAQRARALTRRYHGRTVSLYAPLYLANYCTSGCAYCGFAADRSQPRRCLSLPEVERELAALKAMGFEEVLLLTGERCPEADFGYVRQCVTLAAQWFHAVGIEVFPMRTDEYRELAAAGCSSVTVYQETYDPAQYDRLHRWGPKKDYASRLETPARAMAAGLRTVGLGVLLGLADPRFDALCLLRHVDHLRRAYWRSGVSLSFPRLRPQTGGFAAPFPVSERRLAQVIFAFRIVLPDVPLLLSTRERPAFRDGMAGVGISKMSVASRTTVGGYAAAGKADPHGQFDVEDRRSVTEFCTMLRSRQIEPVFKNWDTVYRDTA